MDEDDGIGADHLCAGGDRAPVIAIGRAADGHALRNPADFIRMDFGDIDLAPQLTLGFLEQQLDDRIRAAECLEAAKAETEAFVLHVQRSEAELLGETGEGAHGGRAMVFAVAEKPLHLASGIGRKSFCVNGIERFVVIRMRIQHEH